MSINTHIQEERRRLQVFVEAMVEEIVLQDKSFNDSREKLWEICQGEDMSDLDYEMLVGNLEDFLENIDMGVKSPDGLAMGLAMMQAKKDAAKCYVSQEKIEEICNKYSSIHPNQEFHPHNPIEIDEFDRS